MFDLPISAVHILETATDKCANTLPTAASSGPDLNGAAVKLACDEILGRIAEILDLQRDKKELDCFTEMCASRCCIPPDQKKFLTPEEENEWKV